MKLKEYSPENCLSTRSHSRSPCLRFNTKTGIFHLNTSAYELLNLKPGDSIKLHQDTENEDEWYIEKVEQGGFIVRGDCENGKGLYFNNTVLCRAIAGSVAYDSEAGKCLIAGTPTELNKRKLFGVLTSSLRNN